MATVAASAVKEWDWRANIFRVVVVLTALGTSLHHGLLALLAPWFLPIDPTEPGYEAAAHLWHEAQYGTQVGILFGGCLVALFWRPRAQPLLLQFLVLANLGNMLLMALTIPGAKNFLLILIIALGILIAAYPRPRALVEFSSSAPISRHLLAVTGLATVFLVLDISRNLRWQLAGIGGEHLAFHHWQNAIFLACLLVGAGALSAMKRPGWRALGIITGVAFLYLGLAALTLPQQAGSWGSPGGILSLLAGALFVTVTLREARTTRGADRSAWQESAA